MIGLTAEVVGEESVATRFTSVQAFLRRRLIEGMKDTLDAYKMAVVGTELSGKVLKPRSGRLMSSIKTKVSDRGLRIVGSAYPRAKYGWMLGLGTPKNEVSVRPLTRRAETSSTFLVKGYSDEGKTKHRKDSQGIQFVRGFNRRMIKARTAKPFMGPAYERTRGVIERRMRAAVERAMADANGST